MKLGDANGSKLLKDPGCLQRQIELLYQHLLDQNVTYAEIRCSPNNYADPNDSTHPRSAWDVLTEIRMTFQKCMNSALTADEKPRCAVNLLIIATRKDAGDRSDISRHLALAITAAQHWTSGCRVVGVDLAGFEHRETRAELFEADFTGVHRVGLSVTCHAGENDDAEGIWQAVFKLNAQRLGHALHLRNAPDLLRAVADRGLGIEMCPFANLQIHGFAPMAEKPAYPLLAYLNAGVRVSVNTDNIGISDASLSDNLLRLGTLCPGITRLDLLRLQRNALDTAFISPKEKIELLKRFSTRLPSTIPLKKVGRLGMDPQISTDLGCLIWRKNPHPGGEPPRAMQISEICVNLRNLRIRLHRSKRQAAGASGEYEPLVLNRRRAESSCKLRRQANRGMRVGAASFWF